MAFKNMLYFRPKDTRENHIVSFLVFFVLF